MSETSGIDPSEVFKAEFIDRYNRKLAEDGELYKSMERRFARLCRKHGMEKVAELSTLEKAVKRDVFLEMRVEQDYGLKIKGYDLVLMGGQTQEGFFFVGSNRDQVIQTVESTKVGEVENYYRNGVNFFVVNDYNDEYHPVDGSFVTYYLLPENPEIK